MAAEPESTEPEDVAWLTGEERDAWLAVAALTIKLPNALDAQLQAEQGLSFFEYMIMAVLSEREDRTLQMSDIAAFTSASLSRLSHAVKRLEGQGFVVRERLPGPGRRTSATLTDAGFDKVVRTAPGHVRHVRHLMIDAVTPSQLRTLGAIGRQVVERIDPSGECG